MSSAIALLAVLSVACTGKSGEAEVGDDTSGDDGSGGGGNGGGGGEDDESPVIEVADAYCYGFDSGEIHYTWAVSATASDPQGADTIDGSESLATFLAGEAQVFQIGMACTDSGTCTTGFTETQSGVTCANAASYTIVIEIVDEDGNWSEPYELAGREGSGPTG